MLIYKKVTLWLLKFSNTKPKNWCHNPSVSKDIDQILFELKCKNPSNNFDYLNIKSVRKKFEYLIGIINENVDIFTIAETKLDGSFPAAQFEIKDYYSRFLFRCYQ